MSGDEWIGGNEPIRLINDQYILIQLPASRNQYFYYLHHLLFAPCTISFEPVEAYPALFWAMGYYSRQICSVNRNYGYYLKMKTIVSSRVKAVLGKLNHEFSEMKKFKLSFLNTTNLPYIQASYESWLQDKSSVSSSFAAYFQLVQKGIDVEDAYETPGQQIPQTSSTSSLEEITRQLKVRLMIDGYRSFGHQFAKIDPLDLPLNKNLHGRLNENTIKTLTFGFNPSQMSAVITPQSKIFNGPNTIQEIEQQLKNRYCDKVGFQYNHLLSKEERDFIKSELLEKVEQLKKHGPTKEEQLATFHRIAQDQTFIDFLEIKFNNLKRFGIEGLNAGVSALGQLAETSAEHGVENIVFGMAHRGRLNTLHCVLNKPAQLIFQEFLQKSKTGDSEHQEMSGDVKYHLGYSHKRKFGDKELVMQIIANPSHLEAANPLVYGAARALQEMKNSKGKVLGVVIHGDAAITGQGVVYESIQFQDLVDYSTGGVIHIVFNNQIGFTTLPKSDRTSYYCTEVAKVINAPVIHVNADEPDIVDKCMKIAFEFRQRFHKDFFIDIVGYRRYGHNEQDQPNFTQPIMYQNIKSHPTVYDIYSKKLIEKGVVTKEYVDNLRNEQLKKYGEDYAKVMNDNCDSSIRAQYENPSSKIRAPTMWGPSTGVPKDVLTELFGKLTTWPSDFNIHPIIKKLYAERIKLFSGNEPLDWPTLESLCWGSILKEGYGIRVSGQDCERGPFSQRHALISDQKRDIEKFFFLKTISNDVQITNSHLSEYGVLGFQYGYSITNPNTLTIWEAQFGDFMNAAEIIIDNFIVSAETKWGTQSGIVVVLPHGMDGQGPEHSQARIERLLDLSDDACDEDQSTNYQNQMRYCNIQVVNCTNGANYFHVLRRQIHRDYRKPLFCFNSKKVLKYKPAAQLLSTVEEGTDFQPVYPDTINPAKVKKVLFVSGQFYWDILARRSELKREDIAIIRIEQLAPFPHEAVKKAVSVYGPYVKYYFAQEEHENFGVFNYCYPRLNLLLKQKIGYYGRRSSASPAVGSQRLHFKEQEDILKSIF